MYRYLISIFLLCMAADMYAADIQCTPGTLKDTPGIATCNDLRISGAIDASDLYYIADNVAGLKRLDLSDCIIAPYNGVPVHGVAHSAASTIPPGAFAGSAIEEIVFASGSPLHIADGAFTASALRQLSLPDNEVYVGVGAFAACPQLEGITTGGNTIIGEYAFRSCPSLTGADLRGAVSIGTKAFAACSRLSSVTFGTRLSSIGASAFEATALREARLASTKVDSIGAWAFARNSAMEYVDMPATVKSIGEGCFADCASLRRFALPPNCTVMADYLLKDCAIETLDLGNISEMGTLALKGNDRLTFISLPPYIEYIADNAMEGTMGLKVLNASYSNHVPALGTDIWHGVDQPSVTLLVKASTLHSFSQAPQWCDFRILDEALSSEKEPTAGSGIDISASHGTVTIHSLSGDICTVELYTVTGQAIAILHPDSDSCSIALDEDRRAIYFIRVTLADASVASFKIAL